MSNLKKVLALALAFAMIMTVMVGAIPAYSDSDDFAATGGSTALLDKAVTTLNDLSIMVGTKTDDGTYFNPTGTLTRAELARLAYAVTHSGAVISTTWNTKNVSKFADINNSWAKGYINYGYVMGYLSGKTETKFDPNGIVTGYELGSVLVRLVRGYAASDIAVWPYDVEKLGRTFGANIFSLGNNVEPDLATPITRQDAAVLLYNSMASKTVTYNTTKNAYEAGNTFLVDNYPSYSTEIKATITAVGEVTANIAGVTGATAITDAAKGTDGYITAIDSTDKVYKLASTKATQAAILADPSVLTLLGTQVYVNAGTDTTTIANTTIANSLTSTGLNKTIAVAKKNVVTVATYVNDPLYAYIAFTGADGTTYSGTVKYAEIKYANDFSSPKAFETATDTEAEAKAAFTGSNSDLVLFTVEGTTIKSVQGAFASTFAKVTSVAADGKTVKFDDLSTTYVNAGATVKVGDYVLYQVLPTSTVTTGNTTANYNNVFVSAVVPKVTYKVTKLKDGAYYAGDTKLAKASNFAGTAGTGSVTGLTLGNEYDAYVYDGLVYKIDSVASADAASGLRNFVYTTTAGATPAVQYVLSTDGTKYSKVNVLFPNNTIQSIAVRFVDGYAVDATTTPGTVAVDKVYKYVKNTDGSYNLYSMKAVEPTPDVIPDDQAYDVDDGAEVAIADVNYTKSALIFVKPGVAVGEDTYKAYTVTSSTKPLAGNVTTVWTDSIDGFTQAVVGVTTSANQANAVTALGVKKEYAVISAYNGDQNYDGINVQSNVTVSNASGTKTLNFINASGAIDTVAATTPLKAGTVVEIVYNDAAGTVVNDINVTSFVKYRVAAYTSQISFTATAWGTTDFTGATNPVAIGPSTVISAVNASSFAKVDNVSFKANDATAPANNATVFYADSATAPTVIFQLIP